LRRDQHIGVARKQFFFEKKNQKTFTQLDDAPDTNGAYLREQKFFGSFFQKRTASFALALLGQRVALNAGWYKAARKQFFFEKKHQKTFFCLVAH
jgi:hypothetical protein